jgi:hypothetical protein
VLSSLLAFGGLVFAAAQIRQARRTAALQALQEFIRSGNERERAILNATASTPAEQHHAFVELLNFLEMYAAAENGKLLVGIAKELVRDKLLDSLAIIDAQARWREVMEKAVITDVNFSHLARFIAAHRDELKICCAQLSLSAVHENTRDTRAAN